MSKGAAYGSNGVGVTNARALVLIIQGLLKHHTGPVPGALGAGHLQRGGQVTGHLGTGVQGALHIGEDQGQKPGDPHGRLCSTILHKSDKK